MRIKTLLLAAAAVSSLAACMQDPASRGLAGAGAGALIADATDGNLLTGAVIGGLAGVATCGINVGLPACNNY
jgi:osmotically inducible lipoprotein OsmB